MAMETKKGAYESDERRTQATLLENKGTLGGKLDVFRGVRDMSEQIIIHAREYEGYCTNDHLRFDVDAAKEAVSNLDAVSSNTQVFVQASDTSKSRGYFACIKGGRLLATPAVMDAAQGNFQVDVDWGEFKKAITKASRKPREKKSTST